MVSIKKWPRCQQPIERLLKAGERSLSDAELLGILIGSGLQGYNAVEIAMKLISDQGSLRGTLKAIQSPKFECYGIGRTAQSRIRAGVELTRRIALEKIVRMDPLQSPDEVANYLRFHYISIRREVVSAFYLDSRNRVVASEDLFFGTLDCANIHPREIVRSAIIYEAVSVIMAHNHPSGAAEPSEADRVITNRVQKSLELLEIRLLDHLVIGEADFTSLARRGWL